MSVIPIYGLDEYRRMEKMMQDRTPIDIAGLPYIVASVEYDGALNAGEFEVVRIRQVDVDAAQLAEGERK